MGQVYDVEQQTFATRQSGLSEISSIDMYSYGMGMGLGLGGYAARKTGVCADLKEVDEELTKIFNKINSHGEMSSVNYSSYKSDLETLEVNFGRCGSYVGKAYAQVKSKLDTYFYEKEQRALALLSSASNLGRYKVFNELGVQEIIPYADMVGAGTTFQEKFWLSFSDFLPIPDDTDLNLYMYDPFNYTNIPCGSVDREQMCVMGFANLYLNEFNLIKQGLAGVEGVENFTLADYNNLVLTGASFNYTEDYSWKTFLSDVLNVTIIYPIAIGIIGYDPIRGYPLTSGERGDLIAMGVLEAAMLVVTLGMAPPGIVTVGDLALYAMSNIGIGMAAAGVQSYSEYGLLQLGASPEIAALVSTGLSIGTSLALVKLNQGYWTKVGQNNIMRSSYDSLSDALKTKISFDDFKALSLKMQDPSFVDDLVAEATKGRTNAKAIMLGKFNADGVGYQEMAKKYGTHYYNLDQGDWTKLSQVLSPEEMWSLNERFLDIKIASNSKIYLSHDPNKYLTETKSYGRELRYLKDHGYHFVKGGDLWVAIKPK